MGSLGEVKAAIAALVDSLEAPRIYSPLQEPPPMSDQQARCAVVKAVEGADVKSLSTLLRANKVDLASVDEGVSILHRAIQLGNDSVVERLLFSMDEAGWSATKFHSISGDLMETTLARRFNTATKTDGYRPLHYAVIAGSEKIVRQLIARGSACDMLSSNARRVSPFLLACELGADELIRAMSQSTKGSCLGGIDANDANGLHLAALNGHLSTCDLLMQLMPQLALGESLGGKTPAAIAFECNQLEIAALINQLTTC